MAEDFHTNSRQKICLCGKKAIRLLRDDEKKRINARREEEDKISFEEDFFPIGVCRKCEITLRTRSIVKVGLWAAHGQGT